MVYARGSGRECLGWGTPEEGSLQDADAARQQCTSIICIYSILYTHIVYIMSISYHICGMYMYSLMLVVVVSVPVLVLVSVWVSVLVLVIVIVMVIVIVLG